MIFLSSLPMVRDVDIRVLLSRKAGRLFYRNIYVRLGEIEERQMF